MSMGVDLLTIKDTLKAIHGSRYVYVQARFGNSEAWIRITKIEALQLVGNCDRNASPEDLSMQGGIFGTVDDEALFLG